MEITSTVLSPVPGGGVTVSIGAASAASAALTKHSGACLIVADVDCFFEIGAGSQGFLVPNDPIAVAASSHFLPAYTPYPVAVSRAGKIAVIQRSAGGTLFISQM